MMYEVPAKQQFDAIRKHIASIKPELIICDFNGVLDDYYKCKYEYIRKVLGRAYSSHIAELAVFTDTEYINDHAATLEGSIRKYAFNHGLHLDENANAHLKKGMAPSSLAPSAELFLKQLAPIPVVVYTAQPRTFVDQYAGFADGVEWISCQQLGEAKPSVTNLQQIMHRSNVSGSEVCVIGDGLLDDLMPAKLLGAHTILVSPFADVTL